MNRTKASNGVAVEDLAKTAHNAFRNALGLEPAEIPEIEAERWWEVASLAIDIVDMPADENAAREVSARKAAAAIHKVFLASGGMEGEFEHLSALEQLAWEVVFRHLANWIDADSGIDLSETEGRWKEWVQNRLPPTVVVVPQPGVLS